MNSKKMIVQEKVNTEWDEMAGEWDDVASWYANDFYELLWNQSGLDPSEAGPLLVLDFGCGTGLLTGKLRRLCSEVVAIDPSLMMMEVLLDKIQGGAWENVRAFRASLASPDSAAESTQKEIEELTGRVDLIVASSVLMFIPEEDRPKTMHALGRFLKPGGLLCHSDWPKTEANPDGMTIEIAEKFYHLAGLQPQSMEVLGMDMAPEKAEVFFGVARKD